MLGTEGTRESPWSGWLKPIYLDNSMSLALLADHRVLCKGRMCSGQDAGSGASCLALHVSWVTSGRLYVSLSLIFPICKWGEQHLFHTYNFHMCKGSESGAWEVLSTGPGTCYLPTTGKLDAEQMCWVSLIPKGPHWLQPGCPSLHP